MIIVIPFENNPGIANTPAIRVKAASQQALKKAFNLEGVEVFEESKFLGQIADNAGEASDQTDVTGTQNSQVFGGAFGHPVFMPLLFEKTSYDYVDKDGTVVIGAETPELFIPLLIIEAERPRNMEMTGMEGFDGTVKEVAGEGDWHIKIRGILLDGGDDQYPEEQFGLLNQLANAKTSIAVANDFFAMIGVADLMFKSIKFSPPEQNSQAFEIDAYSDGPVDFDLDDTVTVN